MKKILGVMVFLVWASAAWAQVTPSGSSAVAVGSCGTPPYTLTAGLPYPIFQDTTGTLCTQAGGGGGTSAVNLTELDGTALGAPANYGTSPGAVKALSVNGFITNNLAPMQTTGGTVGLVAGSAIIGKAGIDQTTPGTTNGVVVNNTVTTQPVAGAFTIAGCTVGSSSAQCLAGSLVTQHLQIQNTSSSATNLIACTFGGTAILNDAGSLMLGQYQSANWGGATGAVPTGALDCISTSGSAKLYVEYK